MHWAFEEAQKIIHDHPNTIPLTCASGISPSGYIHVGNFREVATTYFVVKALKKLGAEPRYILSWDDYDRLRKIPANVSGIAESEIGKAYTNVPSPDGDPNKSYASFFEKKFEADLAKLAIKPEYIYETIRYESGAYDELIKVALDQRLAIYDILAHFRTEAPNAQERAHYYPISLYCDTCGHDATTITDYEEKTGTLHYTCKFGHSGTQIIGQGQHVKLHWKIDWPMRWTVEKVVYEPGGKDHSSKGGSFDVAKKIVKEIFGGRAPDYEPYDFVNIKGQTKKMSSSSGNIITLDELLKIYTPELVFYLYAKYLPKSPFDLGLDEDVLRNYAEFERKAAVLKSAEEPGELLEQMMYLTGVDLSKNIPAFSRVVNILSLTSNNQALTRGVLEKEGFTAEAIEHVLGRASYWIENNAKDRLYQVRKQPDTAAFAALSSKVKHELHEFAQLLATKEFSDDQMMMQTVYDLTPETDKKAKRQAQKELFQAIYHLTLGTDHGPRIPLLVKVVGKDKMIRLIDPA